MEENLKEIKQEIENMSIEELNFNLRQVEELIQKIEKMEKEGELYQNG